MKQFYKSILLVFSFFFSFSAWAHLPMDSLKAIVKREVDHKRSPGMAVGIVDEKGMTMYGYGIVHPNNTVIPNEKTLYEIGSISKVFACILLQDMVSKGEVKLSDPISKYLPKHVKTPSRNGREITLLDLATHHAAFPRMPSNFKPKNPKNPYADYTTERLYEYVSTVELKRDIGSIYEYSNLGLGLLGHILSLRAGVDFETLVQQRITKKLGLNQTLISIPENLKSQLATPYDDQNKVTENWDMGSLAAAGGMRSNVHDLLKFLSYNIGLTKTDLYPILQATHVKKDSTSSENLVIGLGWHIWRKHGSEIIWHNGGTGGYRTFIGFDKATKTGIVILTNGSNGVEDIALHILNPAFEVTPYIYKRALLDTMHSTIQQSGIDAALKVYASLKANKEPGYFFEEAYINALGYELIQANKLKEAIEIFILNTKEFPEAYNTYDSLGEAYAMAGQKELAIANYEKSVQLNPKNNNGIEALKKLKQP